MKASDEGPSVETDGLVSVGPNRSGLLQLEALRPVALRVGRLAEALFGAMEADVVVVREGKVWRGKLSGTRRDDRAAAQIAMLGEDFYWLADTHDDPAWRGQPATLGPDGIRFCACAPILLKSGYRLGALRMFDNRPRPFDAGLADRLRDLAALVADECDRLTSHETWTLREIFDQSPGFIAVLDGPDFIYQMVNPAYVALVGPQPLIGRPLREAITPKHNQGFLDMLDDAVRNGRPCVGKATSIVLERVTGQHDQRYVDFVLQPIVDIAGRVSAIFLQGLDVTFERRTAQALEASHAELEQALVANRAVLDHSADVICMIGRDGRFTQVSKRSFEAWGYTADELVGLPCLDLIHPDDRANAIATSRRAIGNESPLYAFENRMIRKNGSIAPTSWSSVWSNQHNALIAIARDLTESIAAEQKLRHAQKMEVIGRLSGGMAHDFNNLLTIIIGGAETLSDENGKDSPVGQLAAMIRSAGERGAELTRQLLSFARRQPLEPRSVQVNDLAVGMESLLRRSLGEDVELRVIRDDQAWPAMADPAQLESALLNLALNARDAMPLGGKLTIETANVVLDEAFSKANEDIAAGEYLVVAVSDNGEGMSPETISQAIEPFFTTKAVGKGTGLGLSMVHGFVKQSKGNLKIYSELGVGTTIKLYLPRADATEAAVRSDLDAARIPGGAERILLVEDDDLLREHVRKQLDSLGYRVSVAASPHRALEILETEDDIDLLFTDVIMPGGLNGRQLADRANALRPGLKVLYTSGYTDDAIVHHGQLDSGINLLNKPYRKRDLALKLRRVLDE
jgi:PAS domain S-box-containing protein